MFARMGHILEIRKSFLCVEVSCFFIFRYMNWSIHEPNFGESGENCAHYVHHETQEWNDAVCGASVHSLPSICEISDPSDKTAMVTSCPGDIDLTSYNTQCPDGWCPFDGSCYLYIAHSLDWNQAATLCQALGTTYRYFTYE